MKLLTGSTTGTTTAATATASATATAAATITTTSAGANSSASSSSSFSSNSNHNSNSSPSVNATPITTSIVQSNAVSSCSSIVARQGIIDYEKIYAVLMNKNLSFDHSVVLQYLSDHGINRFEDLANLGDAQFDQLIGYMRNVPKKKILIWLKRLDPSSLEMLAI